MCCSALTGMLGAFLGGKLAAYVPSTLLLLGFAIMMLLTSVGMLRGRKSPTGVVREAPPTMAAAMGISVGMVSGLVGAGGLVVPALVLVGGLCHARGCGDIVARDRDAVTCCSWSHFSHRAALI
ncbi:MAG: sulfite exporter TauE/SafE family protein [Polyangiaceae bacterium]